MIRTITNKGKEFVVGPLLPTMATGVPSVKFDECHHEVENMQIRGSGKELWFYCDKCLLRWERIPAEMVQVDGTIKQEYRDLQKLKQRATHLKKEQTGKSELIVDPTDLSNVVMPRNTTMAMYRQASKIKEEPARSSATASTSRSSVRPARRAEMAHLFDDGVIKAEDDDARSDVTGLLQFRTTEAPGAQERSRLVGAALPRLDQMTRENAAMLRQQDPAAAAQMLDRKWDQMNENEMTAAQIMNMEQMRRRENDMMQQMQQMLIGLQQLGSQVEAVTQNQYNHQHAMTMAGMLPANVIHPSRWAFPQDHVAFPDNTLEESGVEIPIHTDEEMELGTEASYHFG